MSIDGNVIKLPPGAGLRTGEYSLLVFYYSGLNRFGPTASFFFSQNHDFKPFS